jgi:ferritin-like metal-binding protein YciE
MSTTMKNARPKTMQPKTTQPMSHELNSELATLFEHQLKDTYFAEKAITKALPKMIKAAHSNELKRAFEKHLEQTHGHVARLESVFQLIGRKAEGTPCQAIKGIIEEGDEVAKMFGKTGAADAGLAASAQAVEHYEIARYGTLKAWAHELGLNEAADLLESTEGEEVQTDELLTQLSRTLNASAAELSESS